MLQDKPHFLCCVPTAAILGLWSVSTPVLGQGDTPAGRSPQTAERRSQAVEAPAIFVDRARETGLDFVHFNGMSGQYYFPEMTGQGGALVDYDNDGDLDVYLVQGTLLGPGKTLEDALLPPPQGPLTDRLFRNDLGVGSDAGPRFVDVTAASRLAAAGYGMGVATGDYDNDGFMDLYVTNYGPNQLWHNRGDGTFADVTRESGSGDPSWSTGATFFDFDRDGWLDLYVVNYVEFSVEKNPRCYSESSRIDYCGPQAFEPVPDRLLRNRGDGTFEDVSGLARLAGSAAAGLGVVAADLDGDTWLDLYVANDGMANQLWTYDPASGTFEDEALLGGAAVNRRGSPEASMGVDAGDFDGDGDLDLFMTHLSGETNTLFVNVGGGLFEDRTVEVGLAANSLSFTSFGTAWLDYDNDGWLDLLIVNGAVRLQEAQARAGDPYPLHQTNQLLHNRGGRGFEDVTPRAGAVFELSEVSRGAAVGDVDNDGDADVLVLNNSGRARLLVNQLGNRKPWLGLRLVGGRAGRDMLGARVGLLRPQGGALWRRVATDGSYASAGDPRVLVGLGSGGKATGLVVEWPDGKREKWPVPRQGRYTTLRQGSGLAMAENAENEAATAPP